MLPSTTERVSRSTPAAINRQIQREIEECVAHYAARPDEIPGRLRDLDAEWDVERLLEANASTLALAGVVLGVTVDRRFLVLPALVTAFLLQHALQGWCPPIPILRRLGFRTASEIDQERYALRALRGDFRDVPAQGSAEDRARRALAAVRF